MNLFRFLLAVFYILGFIEPSYLRAQENENHSLLVVMDMQEEFTHRSMKTERSASLIYHMNLLIKKCRPMNVVFVKANIRVLNISLKGIKTESAEHLDLDSRLDRMPMDPVFMKEKSSGFYAPGFTKYLEDHQINHLILGGIFLGQCLTATAMDALEKGYRVSVVEEAVTARKPKKSKKLLQELADAGAEIIALEKLH